MKNIIYILVSIFIFGFHISSSFASQKVEDIFVDINKNFEYKDKLQYLFDLGFISEENKFFQPNTYISREKFVGLLLETNCTSCVKPDTQIDILSTYYNKDVYYDVNNNSNYFYCIAYADEKKYVQGYQQNTVCDNGVTSDEKPFCPYNSIKFEEALAIIMRTSGILTQQQADEIIQEIYNGKNYPDIGNDIKPRLANGDIYSFYPYFYAAKNYSIRDVDNFGNINEIFLIDPQAQNYFPQAPLTNANMLHLAVFSHKNSECSNIDYNLGGYINILDGSCSSDKTCNKNPAFIINENIDFQPVFSQLQIIQADDKNYQWVITHKQTGEQFLYTGRYLDDISLGLSGEYSVDLFVTDVNGNKGKFSQDFFLKEINNSSFEGFISQNQKANTFNFQANISGNTGPYQYFWDFGDGNTSNEKNPSHSYNQSGKYNVVLQVKDASGKTYNFSSQAEIASKKTDGFPSVELISIGQNHVADFSANDIDAQQYFWDFGDGNSSTQKNPNHRYSQAGTYDVVLITQTDQGEKKYFLSVTIPQNGDTLSSTINIQKSNQQNTYNFSPNIQGGQGPYQYFWDFGDGNSSTQKNPSHTYTTAGDHKVTLKIIDADGNESTSYTQVSIFPPSGSLQALVENTQDPNTFDFSAIDTSNNQDNKYIWDFGDGNSSTQKNPSHKYNNPGEYEVTLRVENAQGTKEIKLIVIVPENDNNLDATAKISSQNLQTNTYGFESEIISGEGPFEYFWDFGDGNSSTQKNPSHKFSGTGPYQVSLVVTDKDGNKIVKNFVVYPDYEDLSTNLEVSSSQEKNSYGFDSKIISGNGPFQYSWDFGDGNSSTQKNPNHTFQYNGEYSVELTTTDKYSNTQKKYVTIVVSDAQNADFNIQAQADKTSGNLPLNVNFTSNIFGNQNFDYQYMWDFGDGSSSSGKNSQHIYYNPGSYIVTLTVTNQAGESKQTTLTISVTENNDQGDVEVDTPAIDTDGDGVSDNNDKCVNLPGESLNQGCPIFETFCDADSDCPENSKCGTSIQGNKTCIAVEQPVTCNDSSQGIIQGNVVCDTCPCQNTLSFKAQLRACDIVFPAIVSPDGKNIYSQGQYFQIK